MMKHNSKYLALLKNDEGALNDAEQEDKRVDAAQFLVKQLFTGSNWFKLEMIKKLSFYTDIPLVRNSLVKFYKQTDDLELKRAIKECHDGTLDVQELIEQKEEEERMEREVAEIVKRMKADDAPSPFEDDECGATDHMSLLAMKTQQVRGSSLN